MALEGWMLTLLGWLVFLAERTDGARPRFDTSTDMGLVLVPADAEIDSVIFRLRATDQDADFPLVFDITATVTPIVRIENLPCTLYNKVCQANVILTRRLIAGRLHDFAVRVKDSKGDSNSMQATISVTNATTQRDKIFPHIPAIIMVPEDTKPGKELDYILVRSNQWSGKPVYIELWQPKELFTIRQRQTPTETRGVITLIGELDFETQSMYTLTIYATDPYAEPKKDTRNIAGLHLVVVVQDVQDVPPIFTLAPPLTKINNTVKPGEVILRVHAEDGDKGVPREVTYGLVSEGNPFTPFFNITETTGEIILARPLEELTQITHVGAPVVLTVVAEEIRRSTMEPPAQATVVEVGLLLGEPGNSPPYFDNDNYVAWMDENAEPGSVITFTEHYSTKVHDEDIGKAGVFALKLDNNNGTFEISPTVAERTANFIIIVRDNSLIDYEIHESLRFKIIAQEVGPATNLSATVPATIFLRDVNDNPPEFEVPSYEVTLSENATAGSRILQVHATDKDTGSFGRIQYTRIIGTGSEAFEIDPDTGLITVSMETSALDREKTPTLRLSIEARDEDGKGLRGTVPFVVNLLDVNDNPPIFESPSYKFTLNEEQTNFTTAAIIKAFDVDAEPPNNEIRYEIIHGNYENKFYLDEITGELFVREPINKVRRTRHNAYQNFAAIFRNGIVKVKKTFEAMLPTSTIAPMDVTVGDKKINENVTVETLKIRKKREKDDEVLFTLTARAYDLGVPHLSGVTQVSILKGPVAGERIVMFVVSGENPDPVKTAETLAAITGGRITVLETRPYTSSDIPNGTEMNVPSLEGVKKSIVVARVEPNGAKTSLVDIERIRVALAANGVAVIDGDMSTSSVKPGTTNHNTNTNINFTSSVTSEEVTIYKAENRLLFWLLIILGLLMLIALIALIVCCICPGCPFYMAPRKRRVHSSETLIARSDGRPRRHLHRKHARMMEASWSGKKQAWSADPTRRNWQFNRRNQKASGLASLPGDVHIVDREHEISDKAASLRLRDGPIPMYLTDPNRRPDDERIYIEDVDGLRGRDYAHVDMETVRPHDIERGADIVRHTSVDEDEQRAREHAKFIREQHFYREGNAEVLRLVTRGQMEEEMIGHPPHRPQTLVLDHGQCGGYRIDGKDILLQRFIEDQKIRHASDSGRDLHDSAQDIERRSMESHHRDKEAINIQQQLHQQKVLLIPERLEQDHRQHIEELGPEVQRLIIDHGSVEKTARFNTKGSQEISGATVVVHGGPVSKTLGEKSKEQTSRQNVNVQHYSIHDVGLARQNALLTRLLLERDVREVAGGAMIDSASYLETQSLPGQVAIATQTDRTAATQTELPNRSRSDNDESEEDARMRRKMKSKKRHGDGEPRRIRTLWMKSPIEEEDMQYSTEKRTNISRKKIKESRRISLEPEVLQAISDSLDENGEPPITARRRENHQEYSTSRVEYRNKDENSRLEESSSTDLPACDDRRLASEKREVRSVAEDDVKSHREEKREKVAEPSFRILEREMSSLSKKLSKLAGRKILRYSNGSETDSLEQTKEGSMDSKKFDKKPEIQIAAANNQNTGVEMAKSKKTKFTTRVTTSETPSSKEQVKIREEVVGDHKSRHAPKYRKAQTISTGSSDFEDAVEKTKKQTPITHTEKHKAISTKTYHPRLKRQNKVEHKENTRASLLVFSQETVEKKDSSDTLSKGSTKSGKSERESIKTMKHGTVTAKTMSDSLSSDHSKNTKVKKNRKTFPPDSGKRSSVVSSESSRKVSQEETVTPIKSDANRTGGSVRIEIEEKNPEVPELQIKSFSENTKTQSDERIVTATASPLISELAMKIVSETVGDQILYTSVRTPEISKLEMKVSPESPEIQRSPGDSSFEKPEDPDLGIKNVPVSVISEISEVPGLSEETSEVKIKLAPENISLPQHEHIPTPAVSPEVSETATSEISQTQILSPIAADETTKIVAEIDELEKSNKFPMADEQKRTEEPSQAAISLPEIRDDEKPTDLLEPVEDTILKMPNERLVDVLDHENKDSMETLQIHEPSAAQNIGTIEDPVPHLMAVESQNKEITDDSQKSISFDPIEPEKSGNIGELEKEEKDIPSDIGSGVEENIQKAVVVTQQTDDAGTFSDNFDSFYHTDMLSQDSLKIEATENNIPYKTLQSESSEDQMTEEEKSQIRNNDEKNDEAGSPKSREIPLSSTILTIPNVEEPKPLSEPVKVFSTDQSGGETSDLPEKAGNVRIPTPISKVDKFDSSLEKAHDDSIPKISSTSIITSDFKTSTPQELTESELTKAETHIAADILESDDKISTLQEPTESVLSEAKPPIASLQQPSPDIMKSDEKTTTPQKPTESESRETETYIASPEEPSVEMIKLDDKTTTPQKPMVSELAEAETCITSPKESSPEIMKLDDETATPQKPMESELAKAETCIASPKEPSPEIIKLDEKTTIPQKPMESELAEAEKRIMSPNLEEIELETVSQKEFGIADSLFVDAKLLKVSPRFEKEVVYPTTVENSKEEGFDDGQKTIDIQLPPVDLIELSRVMLNDGDDSDSSEASSKTMVTARPYGTPRHRPLAEAPIETMKVSEASNLEMTTDSQEADESLKIHRTAFGDDNSIRSAEEKNREASADKQDQSLHRESPEIEKECSTSTSQRTGEEAISPTQNILSSPSLTTTIKSAEGDVESRNTAIEAEMTSNVIGNENKILDTTASPEEDSKTSATDKVELYQICQEKLPADADGLASLPEMNELMKNLDVPKLTEETASLPVQLGKGSTLGKIVKTVAKATKPAASTGKDTKRVGKKREPSKEDVFKKPATSVSSKAVEPKKDVKAKTLKEESSKIGPQSTVAGRFRTMKRQTINVESPIEKQTDSSHHSEKIRHTLRKNDSPDQDVQRDKSKSDKIKKSSSNGETGKLKSKRQIEKRSKQETPGYSQEKKNQDKVGTLKKSGKKIPESEVDETIKIDPAKKLGDQEIVEKTEDQRLKDDTRSADHFKQSEVTSPRETGASFVQSPISHYPETEYADGTKVSDESKSEHENILDVPAEPSMSDYSASDSEKKESTSASEKDTKVSVESNSEHEIVHIPEETEVLNHSVKDHEKEELMSAEKIEEPNSVNESSGISAILPVVSEQVGEPAERLVKDPEKEELMSAEKIEKSDSVNESIAIPAILPVVNERVEEVTEDENVSKGAAIPSATVENQEDEKPAKIDNSEEEKLKLAEKSLPTCITSEKTSTPRKSTKSRKESEMTVIESQSRYMEWYKQKREEMERKRQERKDADGEEERPKWLRKSTRQRWFKGGPEDKQIFDPNFGEATPRRKKIKPLVNVESEQLKAIVRQGRKLRKAQGDRDDDPQIIIFAPEKPPTPSSTNPVQSRLHHHHHHHLVQHSEYNYEKMPVTPFYLHPPPVPHPSPEISPQRFEDLSSEQYQSLPIDSGRPTQVFDAGIIVQQPQGGNKLRHQQLLEKKSVFDIAYSEAAPSHLRSDSTTPPS